AQIIIAAVILLLVNIAQGETLADYEFNDLTDSASARDLAKHPWNSTITVKNGQAVFDGSGFYYAGSGADLIQSQSFTCETIFSVSRMQRNNLVSEAGYTDQGWELYTTPAGQISFSLARTATSSRYYNFTNVALTVGASYYLAAAVDTSALSESTVTVTLYLKNLTDDGEIQTFSVTRTDQDAIHNSAIGLCVGGRYYNSNTYMDGTVDRVRLSAGALSQDRLLKH
ncbi:MAG: hypothetical protein AB7E95_13505, partial [Kiritimatiellales bacterium]